MLLPSSTSDTRIGKVSMSSNCPKLKSLISAGVFLLPNASDVTCIGISKWRVISSVEKPRNPSLLLLPLRIEHSRTRLTIRRLS